jgi:molybdate transport system ATP-binding protein
MLDVNVRRRISNFRLDACFTAGEGVTALFGPSGAGKTTLVNLLAGLERPDDGRIIVDGRVLFDSTAGIDIPPEHRRIGYVFQEDRLFPHLSVMGNLTYGMNRIRPAERRHSIEQVVALLGIGDLVERRPLTLSGGEKQRVAIGRALLASPKFLLMDEPLSSLDAERKEEILPFIERLRDEVGVPIVYVSHAIEEVIRLADTMVVLNAGRVAQSGPVETILSRLDTGSLTGRSDTGAVFMATVASSDTANGLTELAFAGNRLLVPGLGLPAGKPIRVRVLARDVSLSHSQPTGISILNIFQAKITEIEGGDAAQVDLLLDVGVPLIARITRKSLGDLDLKIGQSVYALVKAVAIDRRSLGRD